MRNKTKKNEKTGEKKIFLMNWEKDSRPMGSLSKMQFLYKFQVQQYRKKIIIFSRLLRKPEKIVFFPSKNERENYG